MDFIGPLPPDNGCNIIVTFTDRLHADLHLVPYKDSISAKELASLFFQHWYCENGLPLEIVFNHDKLFVSKFWHAFHKLTGVKLKMSSVYHPQTDSTSECTNKTVIQLICNHVDRHQNGWALALPKVHFDIMNAINSSTGSSPFQIHLGRSPQILPPLAPHDSSSEESLDAHILLSNLKQNIWEAQDNLLAAKISQASAANTHRSPSPSFQVSDCY